MEKRILALCIAALLVLGLTASCGAETVVPDSEPVSSSSGPATDQVADASEMTTVEDVVEQGMVPIYADALRDGVYPVEMKSSSSMFKADHVELSVSQGKMEAVLYMTSKSYLYLFAGTAQEAASAAEMDFIPLADPEAEVSTFTLPVEALDEGLSFAAFSRKKEKWYDRTLLFRADSLPADAFLDSRYTTAAQLGLSDGTYTVEVTLTGGSGRAGVTSPAEITVCGDTCTAKIVWSSSNYDFMIVDAAQYDPLTTEGGSAFEIPIQGFDSPMPVQADTTAMSQPHLIDYTLTFHSATVKAAK